MVDAVGKWKLALVAGFVAMVSSPPLLSAQDDIPPLKMRATSSYAQDQPVGKALDHFAKRVEELSGGKMQVRVYHAGKLYMEDKSIQAVLDGTLDMGMASAGNHAPFTKAWTVLETPYLLTKQQLRELVIRGPIGQELKKRAEKDGLHAVMIVETGGHRVLASNKVVKMPADARQLKTRTAQSPVILAFYRAAGANPTVVPWGETYLALASKTVDATDVSLGAFPPGKLWEVVKNVTTIHWSPAATVLDVSVKWWNERTPKQREIIEQAAREAEDLSMKAEDESEVALRRLLAEKGVAIHDLSPQEREAWEAVGRSIWKDMPVDQADIQRIHEAAKAVN